MHAGEALAIITLILTIATFLVVILRMSLDHIRRTRADRFQAEFYSKLMDRFGAAPEMISYLQSDAGLRLLKTAPPERPATYARILNGVQGGLLATPVGAALLAIGPYAPEGYFGFALAGTVFLAVGLGLLLGGGASYLLSRKLGLLNGAEKG